MRANPQHRKAVDNLSLLYAKLGDRDRASEMLKRSLGETEARVRLAKLFPESRSALPDEETLTASFAPFSSPEGGSAHETGSSHQGADGNGGMTAQPLTTVGGDRPRETRSMAAAGPPEGSSLGNPDPAVAAAKSPLEKQLADLMEQERQRTIQDRAKQQSLTAPSASAVQATGPDQPLAASPWPDPLPQQALPRPSEPAVVRNTDFGNGATPPAAASGRVPDDRINDAFAAIDREGTDDSASAATSAERPAPSRPAQALPWGNSSAEARTNFAPGPQASPLASAPPSPSGASASTNRSRPGDNAANRTASVQNDSDEWESVRSAVEIHTNAGPATIVPSATPNATLPANDLPAPSPSIATRPESANSEDGWDREVESSTPQWSAANAVSPWDSAPSGAGSPPKGALDAPSTQSPRITATAIVPASGGPTQASGRRVPDEMDEFETQLQKNGARIIPGRSLSNAGFGTKPSVQSSSREQQSGTDKPPSARSTAGNSPPDPWAMRIQPRRDPPPLFAPDDSSPTNKQPASDKPEPFDTGTNWSDVPQWQGAPAAKNSSADRENGPAIRPGSF
jgi:hypothetical protein